MAHEQVENCANESDGDFICDLITYSVRLGVGNSHADKK